MRTMKAWEAFDTIQSAVQATEPWHDLCLVETTDNSAVGEAIIIDPTGQPKTFIITITEVTE